MDELYNQILQDIEKKDSTKKKPVETEEEMNINVQVLVLLY